MGDVVGSINKNGPIVGDCKDSNMTYDVGNFAVLFLGDSNELSRKMAISATTGTMRAWCVRGSGQEWCSSPDQCHNRGSNPAYACFLDVSHCDPELLPLEALVATRLYGFAGLCMPKAKEGCATAQTVTQLSQKTGLPILFVFNDPAAAGAPETVASDLDASADDLVLGNRYSAPDLGDAGEVQFASDVSDTLRRLCDHVAPRIDDH